MPLGLRGRKNEYKVPPLTPSLPFSQDLEQNRTPALFTCQVQEIQQKLFWQINRISHPPPHY